jgi:hypothetical protein
VPPSARFRKLTRPIRRAWEALPPFPRLPSRQAIAAWWRFNRQYSYFPRFPRPSLKKAVAWWRERRHERILPPLPRVPTTEEVIRGFRERASEVYGVYGDAVAEVPTPKSIREWIREKPVRKKYLIWWTVSILLLAGAASQVPRGARAVKGWQARRLSAEALTLADQQN